MKRALLRVRRTITPTRALAAAATASVVALASVGFAATHRPAPGHDAASLAHAAHAAMSEDDMRRTIAAWFAKRPEVRGDEATAMAGAFGDTVKARSFDFDSGDFQSDIDTAHVFVGEAVLWIREAGIHTVTSGEDSFDPNAGAMFNANLNASTPTFAFTFGSPGVVPFYCVPHEFVPMKGYVNVRPSVSVTPVGPFAKRVGFVAAPAPNPSRTGFGFRFALRDAGRVRGDVFDASGRAVSFVLDRALEPGSYASTWDGRRRDGVAAEPGVYFIRLRGPGFDESRRVVVGK
jgi:plastocyanin